MNLINKLNFEQRQKSTALRQYITENRVTRRDVEPEFPTGFPRARWVRLRKPWCDEFYLKKRCNATYSSRECNIAMEYHHVYWSIICEGQFYMLDGQRAMDNVSPPLKASRVVCSWQIFMPPFNHLIGKKSVLLKKMSIETEQLGWIWHYEAPVGPDWWF